MPEKLKILVIDDEPQVTRIIKKLLDGPEYEAIELNDPQKVEEYLLYTDLSLVITDLKMPGLDGLEVLSLVKNSSPGLPVIILTGMGSIETAVEATKAGAAEYLSKPVNKENLSNAVRRHIKLDQAIPDDLKEIIDESAFTGDEDVVGPDKIVLKDEIVSTDTIPDGLVEVKFEDILPGQILPFSLYLQIYNKNTRRHYLRKICQENTVFTSGLKQILEKRQLGSAFIQEKDYPAFLEYHAAVKSDRHYKHKSIGDSKKLLLYGKAVEAVTGILTEPVDNKNIEAAFSLVDDIFRTIVDDPKTYQDMFKLFKRDTSIFNHSANVCLLAVSFAQYLGLDEKKTQILGFGSLFHDVGMNRVEKRILDKPGRLTPEEWREIKKHPERGFALLKASVLVPVPALRIILEHHEQRDGSGYPRGLSGNQISDFAHLCRIIDKFDAMTTDKPYRRAFIASDALKRIYFEESSEKHQKIIRQFITFLGGKKQSEAD